MTQPGGSDSGRARGNAHYVEKPNGLNRPQLEDQNSEIIDGWYDAGPDDSVGRADAQESIRRAAGSQLSERWDGKTVEEVRDEWMRRAKERLNRIVELEAERDRYRAALEEIAGHFVPYQRKTYGPVDITLDAIRREVEEALTDA